MEAVVGRDFGWIFREQPVEDYGIDAHAEVVDDDTLVSGRLVGLQVKGGDSWFGEANADGWVFRDSSDHLAYWLGHSLPVIVVLVAANGDAYWQLVSADTVRETEKGFAITVPRAHRFDSSARDEIRAIAGRGRSLLESTELFYDRLPGDAVSALRRSEEVDRLGTARLAERLAGGRLQPGLTVASLAAAQPSWITSSASAQDLWMAVGGYSTEHGLEREAAAAFELASNTSGARAARASAFAGLSLLFLDRAQAEPHLRRADEEGERLLAAIGLVALDAPPDDARMFNIPAVIVEASADELDREPTVLNFLAEMAVRRGEFDHAVEYLERALRATISGSGTGIRMALAKALWRRLTSRGSRSARDKRDAVRHLQLAIEERRRWDGPSWEPLAALLDVHITTGDFASAVVAGLPSAEGGTARDVEAFSSEVARRGAAAALAVENDVAYEFFLEHVGDGAPRNELKALESDQQDRSATDRAAIWTSLLGDADDDDELATRCVARLAKLGQWRPQAEELRARSVLPDELYDTLRAVYRTNSGETELGVASLREQALKSPQAAYELVMALQQHSDIETAIQECRAQIERWGDPTLTSVLADMLINEGDVLGAADVIEAGVRDEAQPVDVRLHFCRWYVSHKAQAGDGAQALAMARVGLELDEDADLAWALITLLFKAGKVSDARAALAQHKPDPSSAQEVRLWLQLHLGVELSDDDARVLIDLAARQPEGEVRNVVVGLLVREVLLIERRSEAPFPPETIAAAKQIAETIERGPGPGTRLLDGEDALREVLAREEEDPLAFQRRVEQVRNGLCSVAELAKAARRPYGAALLHRPAGLLFASDLAPGLRRAGEVAASRAIEAGVCVMDLSSVYLLALLDADDRLRLRAALRDVLVPVSAVDDVVRTRESMRGLAIATYTASLRPDGTIERRTLSPGERALLQERAEVLEERVSSFEARLTNEPTNPSEDGLRIANEHSLGLWCDDVALRQQARARGITTFGIVDLITVLSNESGFALAPIHRRLMAEYVVDLPANGDDLIAVAAAAEWRPGPAHTALARPAWWEYGGLARDDAWLQIAREARLASCSALVDMTKAALVGALASVSASFATQRYQRVVVLALVACHLAGQGAPDNFLDELAQHAVESIAPLPKYVFAATVAELRSRSEADPEGVALRLLSGSPLL